MKINVDIYRYAKDSIVGEGLAPPAKPSPAGEGGPLAVDEESIKYKIEKSNKKLDCAQTTHPSRLRRATFPHKGRLKLDWRKASFTSLAEGGSRSQSELSKLPAATLGNRLRWKELSVASNTVFYHSR